MKTKNTVTITIVAEGLAVLGGTPKCDYACHTAVKAKDYIFHPYQKR